MWILIIAILGENPTIEQVEFRSKELCEVGSQKVYKAASVAPAGSFITCVQVGY